MQQSGMTASYRFADRTDAGQLLAQRLLGMRLHAPVVLALPRGGVPVAREIANLLHAPLDVLLVRKIGTPGQPELALAAVVEGQPPDLVMYEPVRTEHQVTHDWLRKAMQTQLHEIERRRKLYLGGRAPLPVQGRTVILVDDGIATGTTMRAALLALRKRSPGHIIVAVPVAPHGTHAMLSGDVDHIVCLVQPPWFEAISQCYEDFHQLADAEVIACLDDGPPQTPA